MTSVSGFDVDHAMKDQSVVQDYYNTGELLAARRYFEGLDERRKWGVLVAVLADLDAATSNSSSDDY